MARALYLVLAVALGACAFLFYSDPNNIVLAYLAGALATVFLVAAILNAGLRYFLVISGFALCAIAFVFSADPEAWQVVMLLLAAAAICFIVAYFIPSRKVVGADAPHFRGPRVVPPAGGHWQD